MKYLYSIYFWVIGGLIILFNILFVITIGLLLPVETTFKIIRIFLRFWFNAMFIKVEVIYEAEIDFSKPYIFMPNHISFIDVFLAGAYFPTIVNALEAHTHFKWFLYGLAIKRLGHIPINRSRPKSSWNSFLQAIERLKQGRSMVVFPEGHRSGDGHLQEFKKIPFKFAKESGFDVIPTALVGIEKMRQHLVWLKPHKIRLIFAKPITAEEMKNMTVEQLRDKVRKEIERMLEKYK